MIEIAICIAVIGFALVAVIGVLPRGMLTQRDNRADTIIGQEGMYWMEAIRTGAKGLDELMGFVDHITVVYTDLVAWPTNYTPGNGIFSGYDVIGLLSTPLGIRTNVPTTAVVIAISGSAVDKAQATRDLAFKYSLEVDVKPSLTADPSIPPPGVDVSEVVLTLRWPVSGSRAAGWRVGGRSRVFRTQVNGAPQREDTPNGPRFFFKP
jgi:hypothetical protein